MRIVWMFGPMLISMASPGLATNLLINGDFSTGDFTGWENGGNNPNGNEYEGPYVLEEGTNHFAALHTADYGTWMSQRFKTEVGKTYRLTFRAAASGLCGDWYGEYLCQTNAVVYSGGHFEEILQAPPHDDYVAVGYGWRDFSFKWRATKTEGFVDFSSYGPFSVWSVDDVVIQSVIPEPASWALMIAGFGLVGGMMRNRRRVAWA
jgi:hypothetical protein